MNLRPPLTTYEAVVNPMAGSRRSRASTPRGADAMIERSSSVTMRNVFWALAVASSLIGAAAVAQAPRLNRPKETLNPNIRPIFPPRANGAFACFIDRGTALGIGNPLPSLSGRDLSGSVSAPLRLTNDACRASCASQGYMFAGTQSGAFCFCGSTVGHYGAAANCSTGCDGYPGEVCGGTLANSVSFTGFGAFAPQAVPPPPANGGQCVVDVSGPGYHHFEVQTWVVSGPPIVISSAVRQYPMIWSTSGGGNHYEASPASGSSSAINFATWRVSGSGPLVYQAQVLSNPDRIVFGRQSNPAAGTLTERQQQYIGGVAQTPVTSSGQWLDLQFPLTFSPVDPTLIATSAPLVNMLTGDFDSPQPGSSGTATCTWHVVR